MLPFFLLHISENILHSPIEGQWNGARVIHVSVLNRILRHETKVKIEKKNPKSTEEHLPLGHILWFKKKC